MRLLAAPEFTSKKVKKLREELGVTQGEFATIMNVKVATVRSWEQGQRKPADASNRLLEILEKQGPETLRALIIFCEQNKITEYEIFADENQSGTKASRPSLDRMMKAVENGEIETVVVFAFSRYARSVSHMLKGLEVFRKCQTNFVSLTEKLDLNTSLGHVVFVIISAIAHYAKLGIMRSKLHCRRHHAVNTRLSENIHSA